MDFAFTEDQTSFRLEFRDWLEEHIPEEWKDIRDSPHEDEDRRIRVLQEWQRTLAEDNWVGIHWSEEYGGRGATLLEQAIYREEMARAKAPPIVNEIGINFVGPTLVAAGTAEQQARFLPHILDAAEIWCQGYSEPEAGSDIASIRTTAEKEGDEWIINGQKIWTSGAHFADWCFLVARTDSSGTKYEGITTFLVKMDQPDIRTERIRQINGRGNFNQVFFDDAIVRDTHVVGDVGQGWDVVMTLSAFEHASSSIFSIEQHFFDVLEYCRTTTRDGSRLVDDPHIRQRLAALDCRIQAAKLTFYRNISKRQADRAPGPKGSMDQLMSDEIRIDLANLEVDVRGPEGALWRDTTIGHGWGTGYPGAYGSWIAAGTGDIQRNIIGERVLGLPKDIKSETSHRV